MGRGLIRAEKAQLEERLRQHLLDGKRWAEEGAAAVAREEAGRLAASLEDARREALVLRNRVAAQASELQVARAASGGEQALAEARY